MTTDAHGMYSGNVQPDGEASTTQPARIADQRRVGRQPVDGGRARQPACEAAGGAGAMTELQVTRARPGAPVPYRAPSSGGAGDPPAPDDGRAWKSRGYLPHFDQPGAVQMLTFRLADSMPKSVLAQASEITDDARKRARLEQLLDHGYGSCGLSDPRVGGVVESTLRRFDCNRYMLIAWVVMPNHVHVLIETLPTHALARVMQSWKSQGGQPNPGSVRARSGRRTVSIGPSGTSGI